ncbi:hypothetical protein OBK28_08925, partial [Empedobacter falsenii]
RIVRCFSKTSFTQRNLNATPYFTFLAIKMPPKVSNFLGAVYHWVAFLFYEIVNSFTYCL